MRKWCPTMRPVKLLWENGTANASGRTCDLESFDVCVTHEAFEGKGPLCKINWSRLLIDEAHASRIPILVISYR